MGLSGKDLLESMNRVDWEVAGCTYGNSHATLVGLIVAWWVREYLNDHRAIESAPSYKKGLEGGYCDALLCAGGDACEAVGLLEVEGLHPEEKVKRIGDYFGSDLPDLRTLSFAVLVLYRTGPRGRGPQREFLPLSVPDGVPELSGRHPEKPVIVVTIDKKYHSQGEGARQRSDYPKGTITQVRGFAYEGGKQTAGNSVLWKRPP